MTRTPRTVVAVCVALLGLGLVACGEGGGAVGAAPAGGTPEPTALDPGDCPGGIVRQGMGARHSGAKGYPTPEEAGESFLAHFNMSRKKKAGPGSARVDTGAADRVRLLYSDDSGVVVVQVDVSNEGAGWLAESYLGCGKES
jgi:hypothetical protein